MFAGAAREAVFSNPEVIRKVNAEFIPVALKAGLVNNPPNDDEGRLYREIRRSRPAPQGICVANSAGKVLAWALMFDDDKNVLGFLDHARARYAKFPDAKEPVAAERFMRFPSHKLPDTEDSGKAEPVADRHPAGKNCPAQPPLPPGTILARVYGRAFDADGKPMPESQRQEHYTEDQFAIPLPVQERLTKTIADAGDKRFQLPDNLSRLLVSHAYLGQLDVNPLGSPAGGKGDFKVCEMWAERVASGPGDTKANASVLFRLEGQSELAGGSRPNDGGDGRSWEHSVKLAWHGFVEVQGNRLTRLLLLGRGSEKLRWGSKWRGFKEDADVAHLPAGHPINLDCAVRYGIVGEPVKATR